MEKGTCLHVFLCAVFPNLPSSLPAPPPFSPLFFTHACSPLIGRLPQVAVELGRAPQKRSLRSSTSILVSSRCDRKKKQTKKHPTMTHDDDKTCPNQVEIFIVISSWQIICGRIAAIGRDWSQSDVCLFPFVSPPTPAAASTPSSTSLQNYYYLVLFF